jgi:CubicO group peptidase (beta-lactamase class C family)
VTRSPTDTRAASTTPYNSRSIRTPTLFFGPEELLRFLADYELRRDIGSHCEYSNYGYALLGYLLEQALRSTAEDMLRFVGAALGLMQSDLTEPFDLLEEGRFTTGMPNIQNSLGRHTYEAHEVELLWHDGGTGGFSSFIGFCEATKTGVVVLANSTFEVASVGFQVLDPATEPAELPAEVTPANEILQAYVWSL